MLELVMNRVRWPFRLVRNTAAETISEIRDDSVNKDRVYTIMNIVSLLPLITAVVVFVVAMISFTVNSGFAIQIDMVKKDFFGSLSDIWTSGTSGYFYNMWLCLAVGISYLVICSAAVIDAYRGLDGKGKVFLTVILVLFNTVFGTFYFVAENDTKVFNFMQDLFGLGRDTCTGIMIGLFIATVIKAERFKYNYGRKWKKEIMTKSIIKLPAKDEKPDFHYMEEFIKALPYSDRI